MAQMSVEEILMTYSPLEEDARELVDLYYRVRPLSFYEFFFISRITILLPPSYSPIGLGRERLIYRPLAGSPILSLYPVFKLNTSTQFTTPPLHRPHRPSQSYSWSWPSEQ